MPERKKHFVMEELTALLYGVSTDEYGDEETFDMASFLERLDEIIGELRSL